MKKNQYESDGVLDSHYISHFKNEGSNNKNNIRQLLKISLLNVYEVETFTGLIFSEIETLAFSGPKDNRPRGNRQKYHPTKGFAKTMAASRADNEALQSRQKMPT